MKKYFFIAIFMASALTSSSCSSSDDEGTDSNKMPLLPAERSAFNVQYGPFRG